MRGQNYARGDRVEVLVNHDLYTLVVQEAATPGQCAGYATDGKTMIVLRDLSLVDDPPGIETVPQFGYPIIAAGPWRSNMRIIMAFRGLGYQPHPYVVWTQYRESESPGKTGVMSGDYCETLAEALEQFQRRV